MTTQPPKQKITLPKTTMFEDSIIQYAKLCNIPNFKGVAMRDEILQKRPLLKNECGVLNLNKHTQTGSHWTCWMKKGSDRYYFDSFGERPPNELIQYLKTEKEMKSDSPVIKCNAVTVQHYLSNECGGLCLYVMYHMMRGDDTFTSIIKKLQKRYEKPTSTILRVDNQ